MSGRPTSIDQEAAEPTRRESHFRLRAAPTAARACHTILPPAPLSVEGMSGDFTDEELDLIDARRERMHREALLRARPFVRERHLEIVPPRLHLRRVGT